MQTAAPVSLSRIDKLWLDDRAQALNKSRAARQERGLAVVAGDDVARSYGLQLALLTAVNLGARTFATAVNIFAADAVWQAHCLVPAGGTGSLGEAMASVGGSRAASAPTDQNPHLVIGNGLTNRRSLRVTFDGWIVQIGPVATTSRLPERMYCPTAPIAAAAIAVGEMFGDFADLNLEATRRTICFSLWRPDLEASESGAIGEPVSELPAAVGVFGLGHLGQAYVWTLGALRYEHRDGVEIALYDDDYVEDSNLETGALLKSTDLGIRKTRVAARWLENIGFSSRIIERRISPDYRIDTTVGHAEPVIGLSGFDDNRARQWLTNIGLQRIFDSGLGGKAHNFDTIAFHAWPNNPRSAADLWKVESHDEQKEATERLRQAIRGNEGYNTIGGSDECGRLDLAGKSVAVPFVGAMAASVVVSELLKSINGGPIFSDITLRMVSSDSSHPRTALVEVKASPIRGLAIKTAFIDRQ